MDEGPSLSRRVLHLKQQMTQKIAQQMQSAPFV
jgi:hypothetical protein